MLELFWTPNKCLLSSQCVNFVSAPWRREEAALIYHVYFSSISDLRLETKRFRYIKGSGFTEKYLDLNSCDGQGCPKLWRSRPNRKEQKLVLENVCYLRKIRMRRLHSFCGLLLLVRPEWQKFILSDLIDSIVTSSVIYNCNFFAVFFLFFSPSSLIIVIISLYFRTVRAKILLLHFSQYSNENYCITLLPRTMPTTCFIKLRSNTPAAKSLNVSSCAQAFKTSCHKVPIRIMIKN
jgi:hypothetical protein